MGIYSNFITDPDIITENRSKDQESMDRIIGKMYAHLVKCVCIDQFHSGWISSIHVFYIQLVDFANESKAAFKGYSVSDHIKKITNEMYHVFKTDSVNAPISAINLVLSTFNDQYKLIDIELIKSFLRANVKDVDKLNLSINEW